MNTSDLSHKSRVFIEKDQLKSDDKGKKIIFNSDARLVAVSTGLSQVGCVVLLGFLKRL